MCGALRVDRCRSCAIHRRRTASTGATLRGRAHAVCLSVCLSVCLPACLSACLPSSTVLWPSSIPPLAPVLHAQPVDAPQQHTVLAAAPAMHHRDPRICPGCLGHAMMEGPDLSNITFAATRLEPGASLLYPATAGAAASIHSSTCLSVCLSACLRVYLSVFLPFCMPVSLSASPVCLGTQYM
jgi:hypothetical protein